MSASSDQGVGYFWNLVVGFAVLVLFGITTFLIFQVGGLKRPSDRVMEGDFSAEQTALRIKNLEEVRQEQAVAVKSAKLESAMQSIKATPPAATEVVVPGSPTSLKAAAQPPAAPPIPESPPADAKGKAKAPPADEAKPKGKAGKGKATPKAKAEPKPKGKAAPEAKAAPKGEKAKTKSPGQGKGEAKASQAVEAKGN